MRRTIRDEGRVASAWAISIVGHFVAVGLGGLLVAATLKQKPVVLPPPVVVPQTQEDTVEIELPKVVDSSLLTPPPAMAELPKEALPRGGGEAMPRLDTGHAGRGGMDTSPTPAINLADRDEDILLSPEVLSRIDRSQINRIKASRRRASYEDWRASREPMELTFVAQGDRGTRPERRKPSDFDPSSGGRAWGPVTKVGGVLGAAELPPGIGERARQIGGPVEGAAQASAGRGVRDGAPGHDNRDSALAAFARPMVQQGSPSVPADARDKPTDNVDSEQEVATRVQSILHASNAGGALGPGTGGQNGPGPAGAGGQQGAGSVSHALGTGQGNGLDNDPRDKRRMEYLRQVIAKVYPHTANALPKALALEGAQGVVIVSFTILADGSITGVAITRPSGIPELDENCKKAVLKAAPFPPLPPELGTSFRHAMPMDFRNPAVRPRSVTPHAKAEPIER
jgi:TonB family protein